MSNVQAHASSNIIRDGRLDRGVGNDAVVGNDLIKVVSWYANEAAEPIPDHAPRYDKSTEPMNASPAQQSNC